MTLKEAKELVAKQGLHSSWTACMFAARNSPITVQEFNDEAAELYAKSEVSEAVKNMELLADMEKRAVWDRACEEQKHYCWSQLDLQANQNKVMKAPKPEFKP